MRKLSESLDVYINRLGSVWIDAEITQWGVSGGHVYGRVKDPEEDVTVDITIWRSTREKIPDGVGHGDRVLLKVKPNWYVRGGKLSMNVLDMRLAGLGELLAKIEALRLALAAEGLFDPERKNAPPFLPRCVGLVTARDSDAEKDVLHNATARWPEVQFQVEHASVQGDRAVPEIIAAVDRLEVSAVDVIVIARGGGDFQHLLPFSDEVLLRRVAALDIPVISAIGHEADKPLLDDVADVRASTPTDAAKRVVPDVAEERLRLTDARSRLTQRVANLIDGERQRLDMMRQRPVLAMPLTVVDRHAEDVLRLVQRGVDVTDTLLSLQGSRLESLRASVRALSPQATLDRGYAIVHKASGELVSSPQSVTKGDALRLRVKDGDIAAEVTDS